MYDPAARRKGVKNELKTLVLLAVAVSLIYVTAVRPHENDFDISRHQCGELNRHWQEKYRHDFIFASLSIADTFDCLSEQSGLAQALRLFEKLGEGAPSDAPFDFYNWVKDVRPSLQNTPLLFQIGRTNFERRMVMLDSELLKSNNTIQIAAALVHETRHVEEGFNSHVPCLDDISEQLRCDDVLEADLTKGGAYNYTVLFLERAIRSAHTTSRQKRRARRLLMTLLDHRFNRVSETLRTRYEAL